MDLRCSCTCWSCPSSYPCPWTIYRYKYGTCVVLCHAIFWNWKIHRSKIVLPAQHVAQYFSTETIPALFKIGLMNALVQHFLLAIGRSRRSSNSRRKIYLDGSAWCSLFHEQRCTLTSFQIINALLGCKNIADTRYAYQVIPQCTQSRRTRYRWCSDFAMVDFAIVDHRRTKELAAPNNHLFSVLPTNYRSIRYGPFFLSIISYLSQ